MIRSIDNEQKTMKAYHPFIQNKIHSKKLKSYTKPIFYLSKQVNALGMQIQDQRS